MGRRDILKSLLRSTTRSAVSGIARLPLAVTMQRLLAEASIGRATLGDAQLTRAAARVPHVTAVTVVTAVDALRVDVAFDDGSLLAMAVRPAGLTFAPGGAKELSFHVAPLKAADSQRGSDIVGAIASEIARSLWRPALVGAPHSDHGAIVTTYEGRMVVDLRSVPVVRWALRQPTRAALIEAIRARAVTIENQRLTITLRNPLGRNAD